jgi:hypothetical protein
MAIKFNRSQTFATNGTVTAAGLHNLIDGTDIYQALITDQTNLTSVGSADELLIADADLTANDAPRAVTVNELFEDALTISTYTNANINNISYGTSTGTRLVSTNASITTGTIPTLTSSTASITIGTIPTLTAGTTTSTAATITSATITTGTIPTLVATTLVTTGTGTAAAPAIVPTGDTNTGIFFPAADTIAFAEGGTEAMRIDSSGNLGIGTSSPATPLDVNGAITADSLTLDGSGSNPLRIENAADPYIEVRDTRGTTRTALQSADGIGAVGTISGHPFRFLSSNVERARIDAVGNVGIGTTSPQKELQINATEPTIRLEENGAGSKRLELSINSNAEAKIFANQSGGTLILGTVGTERLRIDSSGNVGIGTTGPSAALHSVSTSASTSAGIFQITATSSTSQAALSVIKQDSNTTTNQTFVLFQHAGGTNCGKINANGANTAAFGSTSDARLKENITALPSQIDNVCALRPCEFDYKDGSGHQIGFIAQEMQEVYPDSVGVGDDGMLTITAWSKTEARLVKAIQELKAKNDLLEARLEALEAK